MKKADLQDLLSFESCRSSAVDHVEELNLESARKMQDEQEVMGETQGMRREDEEKTGGGWNQKGKRRRWKPEFFGTGWKASLDTLMVKVTMSGGQVKSSRRESEAPGEEGEEV